MIGGSLGSALIGKRAQSQSSERLQQAIDLTPEEKRAQSEMFGVGGNLKSLGSLLYGAGVPYLNRAGSYWQNLLGAGGKKRAEQAVAPMAEGIAETYGGAERSITGSNLRGGVRETALADLAREKSGAIGGLLRGVQPQAAGELGRLGQYATSTGIGATSGAGGIFSDILGRGAGDRRLKFGAELESERRGTAFGESLGSLMFQLLTSGAGKKGGGSGGKYQGAPIGTPSPIGG
jgi:hypothetical protein